MIQCLKFVSLSSSAELQLEVFQLLNRKPIKPADFKWPDKTANETVPRVPFKLFDLLIIINNLLASASRW